MAVDADIVLKKLKEENIHYLQLQFSDILGNVKTVTVPENRFESAMAEGVVFDGSSVAGYAQIEESDMRAFPDMESFQLIPDGAYEGKVARFICKISDSKSKIVFLPILSR